MKQLAATVGELLQIHGLVLATAESCTGGGIASALTDIAGSSAWFDRGFVTYSNQSKVEMLGVLSTTLERDGAVSEATVREMVAGVLNNSHAQIALSVSGIAGPGGGTAEKPVGTVWLAWQIKGRECVTRLFHFNGDRAEIRKQAIKAALQGVLEILTQRNELA